MNTGVTDNTFSTPNQVGYEPELLYPSRGNHGQYVHHVDYCVDVEKYTPESLENIIKRFDWSGGVDEWVNENGTITPNVDGITDDVRTFDDCLSFWANNGVEQHYLVMASSAVAQATPYRVTGWYYIPATNTNVNGIKFNDSTIDEEFTVVGKWTYIDTLITTLGGDDLFVQATKDGDLNFTGVNSSTDDIFYLAKWSVSKVSTQAIRFFRNPKTGLHQECFIVNERITGKDGDLLYFRRTYAPEFADVVSYGSADFVKQDMSSLKSGTLYAATFDAKQTVTYSGRKEIQAVGSIDEVQVIASADIPVEISGTMAISRDSVSASSVDLTQSAAAIKAELIASGFTGTYQKVTGVTKSGNQIRIVTNDILGSNYWSIDLSGITDGTAALVNYETILSVRHIVITYSASRAIVSGTMAISRDSVSASSVDLTQSAAAIKAELIASGFTDTYQKVTGVTKSGNQIRIVTNDTLGSNYWSIDLSGIPEYIVHEIYYETIEGVRHIVINFTDSRSISETYTNQSAIRSLQVNGHGITDVGTRIPIFKGDELVSTTSVSVITDANNIMVPLDDVPGADFQATHIGDPATATVFDLSVIRAPSRITSAFFIPGITSGITTPDDIPVIEGDESAANQLAAIAASDTYLQVASSDLEQVLQGLYARTVQEVKRVDVFG